MKKPIKNWIRFACFILSAFVSLPAQAIFLNGTIAMTSLVNNYGYLIPNAPLISFVDMEVQNINAIPDGDSDFSVGNASGDFNAVNGFVPLYAQKDGDGNIIDEINLTPGTLSLAIGGVLGNTFSFAEVVNSNTRSLNFVLTQITGDFVIHPGVSYIRYLSGTGMWHDLMGHYEDTEGAFDISLTQTTPTNDPAAPVSASVTLYTVPLPASLWLFGSAIVGFLSILKPARRKS